MADRVTSPEEFFGFQLGSDRKLARWNQIVDYFYQLESESDRIRVQELGKSTEGNPFLLVIISSPDNLANLERLREVNLRLSDPRGLSEEEIDDLVAEGRAVICQSMSLHATEVGGTQMAPELAFDLLSDDSEATQRILDNTIFLMVPCFNPDGQLMVTDWYNRWVDTEYEGSSLPWLYHKYAGHDNNRDAFMMNLAESQHMGRVLFREWRPQAYQDHHHMGSYGARLYVAPYCDPIHPYAAPLIWRELSWYGAHMAYKLEEAGKQGILNAAQFPGWGHLGFHWITNYHNTAGMLTESASARLATPLYIHPDQLKGASARTMPDYEPQTNFPNPWPGGWWRLRDIVEQQKISAWALLDLAARHRETVLRNAVRKAQRQVKRGETEKPVAFVIPADQHDPLTVRKLAKLLLNQGIELHQAADGFTVDGRLFASGTFVVFAQQPKWGLIKTLLERTLHPDNYWTREPDGSPVVFDTATDTVAEFMGVEVVPVDSLPVGRFSVVNEVEPAEVSIPSTPVGYALDGRLNDAFRVVNRLLARDIAVSRFTEPLETAHGVLPVGAFFVDAGDRQALEQAASDLGVPVIALQNRPQTELRPVRALRTGLYQRYWGGNMDEGWTRFVLDTFEFPYEMLMDKDIWSGNLAARFDVIILPSDMKPLMMGLENVDPDKYPRLRRMLQYFGGIDSVPPEYRSGLGQEGVAALKEFVTAGGRLVVFDRAAELVVEEFKLGVENVVEGLDSKTFFSHGNTLRIEVNNVHPLGFGMPNEALALHWDSPAFEIRETRRAHDYEVVARYPQRDILQSGWLVGEDRIAGKAALLTVRYRQGEIVLIGFRCQHRGQTHGTFKFLFNCLL